MAASSVPVTSARARVEVSSAARSWDVASGVPGSITAIRMSAGSAPARSVVRTWTSSTSPIIIGSVPGP